MLSGCDSLCCWLSYCRAHLNVHRLCTGQLLYMLCWTCTTACYTSVQASVCALLPSGSKPARPHFADQRVLVVWQKTIQVDRRPLKRRNQEPQVQHMLWKSQHAAKATQACCDLSSISSFTTDFAGSRQCWRLLRCLIQRQYPFQHVRQSLPAVRRARCCAGQGLRWVSKPASAGPSDL